MLTLNDGRAELWQWDTGRTLAVDADCSQVHFSNKVFGRSIDVDVVDGVATIPDILLQTDKDLNVWAFVGTAENGYTKISKTFKVNRRNKPADYVFTPTDQMTLQTIQSQIGDLADLTTEAKDTLVAAINEAARTGGGAGSMDLRVADGYVQYSADGGMTWTNLIAMADLKGDPGEPGKDGHSPVVTATKSGKTTTSSVDGTAIATVEDGADGAPGSRGADGITPTIGSNGNWYLGDTDTGKPSRGEDGATGATGATGEKGTDGKSAYAYAVDGGYTGTEAEFAAKMASEALIVHITGVDYNLSADKTYVDIRDAILAGTTVFVDRGELYLPLVSINIEYQSLLFGTITCVNDDTGKMVYESLIEITQNDEVKDISALVEIPATLPNPNALTFTGAVTGSYDGSAPLTVEIPSGGGEDELPIIQEYTIEGDKTASIVFTGLPNISDFLLEIEWQWQSTGVSGTVRVSFSDSSSAYNQRVGRISSVTTGVYGKIIIRGRPITKNGNIVVLSAMATSSRDVNESLSVSELTSTSIISVWWNDSGKYFPAGTTVRLRGK